MVKRMEHMVIVIVMVMVMDKAGNGLVLCFLQKSALGLNMFSNILEHRKDYIQFFDVLQFNIYIYDII